MESISSENLPLIWHTLSQLELAINRLQERTKTILSVDDFLTSPVGMEKLDAACMVLIAIGESVKNLDKVSEGKLLPTYPSIPWKRVMGIRDIMAHHYFEVDADVVYEVVKKELEPLKQAIAFFKDQLFEEENKQ
jgi:uncharacterized protein with HEPN domain